MKSIDRLYQYLDYKNVKPTNFEREIGFSSGYLSGQKKRNGDFGESVLRKIIEYCPDLNGLWLLTGMGAMLTGNEDACPQPFKEEAADRCQNLGIVHLEKEIIRLQADAITKRDQIIELMSENSILKEELYDLRSAGSVKRKVV